MRARWDMAGVLPEQASGTTRAHGRNRKTEEHGPESAPAANAVALRSMVVPRMEPDVPLQEIGGDTATDAFELRDPAIASEIIDRLRAREQLIEVEQEGVVVPATVLPGASQHSCIEMATAETLLAGQRARLRARIYDVLFVVEGTIQPSESTWQLVGPFRLYCVNRRCTARVSLEPRTGRLLWASACDGDVRLAEAPLCDFGIDGVGVQLPAGMELGVEESFPALVDLDGETTMCLAEVRRQERRDSVAKYGIRLRVTGGRQSLVDSYLDRRFPQLVERATVGKAAMLDLLEKSGYLDLRAETRPPEKWFALPETRGLSRDICYRALDGAVIGHISATRAYSRAWLGHQIATLKDHPETVRCRRDIYLHIAAFATSMDGEETVMYGYFDRSKKWHRLFFHDFVRWVDDPSLAVIAELDRFERVAPGRMQRTAPPPGAGVEVTEPDDEELILATALIRSQLPPLVSETLDIHPEQLACRHLHDVYRDGLYRRERRVLVLRWHGKLVGVALCELGSRELTLFNIFNMAFFFFVTGNGAPTTTAQLALLDSVRSLYADHGELNPMIVSPPGTFDATSEPGTILAETMGLIAKSGRSLRQYESFIRYRFGTYLDVR